MAPISFELQKPALTPFENSLAEATSEQDEIVMFERDGAHHAGSYFHSPPSQKPPSCVNTLSLRLNAAEQH